MTTDRLTQAIKNNAAWCDIICRLHEGVCETHHSLWLNHLESPPLYPNAVTLARDDVESQERRIDRLCSSISGSFAVKDSYANLDLKPLGFQLLFESQWMAMEPGPPLHRTKSCIDWKVVSTSAELVRWETAQRLREADGTFNPSILNNSKVQFLAGWLDDSIVAGAILNQTPGVTGWSNFFNHTGDSKAALASGLRAAQQIHANVAIVGYESGANLVESIDQGFQPLGTLRVWLRQA